MKNHLLNIFYLCGKELRSLLTDAALMMMMIIVFSVVLFSVHNGVRAEVNNASIAVIDEDQSPLSNRIKSAIIPPYFKHPVEIKADKANQAMDKGRYIFVLNIPPHFQTDLEQGRQPKIQILTDATAMTQAGLGTMYLQNILTQELLKYAHIDADKMQLFEVSKQIMFNSNAETAWFSTVMQIVNNITLLAIVLVGSAVIRERERGTIEHLLVMPINAYEVALAKIIANSLVILIVATLSLYFIVHKLLGIPIAGSLLLFIIATSIYLFSASALGIVLAILAPSLPQFGLLATITIIILIQTSGAITSIESMPILLQNIVQISPTTQFVQTVQNIVYRGSELSVIWPRLLIMLITGLLFLYFALSNFRSMLEKQG